MCKYIRYIKTTIIHFQFKTPDTTDGILIKQRITPSKSG